MAIAPNRRDLLAALFAAAARLEGQTFDRPVRIEGKRPMILHNDRPEDLETPPGYFQSWLTPVNEFFVRQHLPRPPRQDPAAYRLSIEGMVSKSAALALADLKRLPQHVVPATLECTGNGRAFYSPKVPGIQWKRGAVGNAEWRGPRLSEVLKLAGVSESARHVLFDGADAGALATPDFVRSLPMAKAMHPATILALSMNGDDPPIHGFPVRLIVPGWDGTSWVKWVTRIAPQEKQSEGFFMNPAYRIPKYALPPGTPARPAELEVIEGMPVKSSIMQPDENTTFSKGPVEVRGVAWAGENAIQNVQLSFDGGSRWVDAQLSGQQLPFAWRLFRYTWTPDQPGYFNILSRATDTEGRVQPWIPAWNPSGYLWNGIDRVGVTVEAVR